MKAYDFEYDGVRLSDKGFIICKFDSDSVETISNGSEITFNTVSTLNGIKHELTSSQYEECLTATFQICKNPCGYNGKEDISLDDTRDIMRWLNRNEFHKLRLLDDEYSGIYFEASFNVSKIEVMGKTFGFELEMFTNRPFAIQDKVVFVINNDEPNEVKSFFSKSDQEGHIYPSMEITIGDIDGLEDKDKVLEIRSITEDRTMKISNCTSGEVIRIDYPIIQTSLNSHKIQNDFNWTFYRIVTSFKNRMNEIEISLPCSIKIEYSPIVKVGI